MSESEFVILFGAVFVVLLLAYVVLTSDDLPRPRGRKK
jgi:hypothetical protein